MNLQNVIGIDPDSSGFEVALFQDKSQVKPERRYFPVSEAGLSDFLTMVKKLSGVVIAIEGSNGHSQPIEQSLRKENIVFYSFKPAAVNEFRKSVLGQNKNNKIDAEATARYAITLAGQGILEKNQRIWFPDEALMLLTRMHTKRIRQKTADVNELWKTLHMASPDLYLALKGKNAEKRNNNGIIQSRTILSLLINSTNSTHLNESDTAELLIHRKVKDSSREQLNPDLIKKVVVCLSTMTPCFQEIIKYCAERILIIKKESKSLEKLIAEKTMNDSFIKMFTAFKGIGILTAAKIKAEMIDVRRFINDDHLASYAGLCLKDKSTGSFNSERSSQYFNHRLKDIFMTAVRNYIKFNSESHLAGYYRNLIKHRKMKVIEARKRAARAFVRTVFKLWNTIIELQFLKQTEKEGNMARVQSTHNPKIKSNILPSPKQNSIKNKKRQQEKREMVLT